MAQICLLILESQGLKSGTQKLLISLKRREALAIRLACRCDSKLTEHHKPLKKKEQEMEAPRCHGSTSQHRGCRSSVAAWPFHLSWLGLTRCPPYSQLPSFCSLLRKTQLAQSAAGCRRRWQLSEQMGKAFVASMSLNALNHVQRALLQVPAQAEQNREENHQP